RRCRRGERRQRGEGAHQRRRDRNPDTALHGRSLLHSTPSAAPSRRKRPPVSFDTCEPRPSDKPPGRGSLGAIGWGIAPRRRGPTPRLQTRGLARPAGSGTCAPEWFSHDLLLRPTLTGETPSSAAPRHHPRDPRPSKLITAVVSVWRTS